MTDVYDVYNALMGIMCDRCAEDIRRDCHRLPDQDNFGVKIRCMKKILKPEDGEYPTKFRKVKK